ncbi:hypothetical protein HanHA300_Chr04g0149491 [Helianthus annuus]|nr:hypothetical protein HanHA300_Chr04g0149491 [Helianthus annuus]
MSPTSLHQRPLHKPYTSLFQNSSSDNPSKPYNFSMILNRTTFLLLLTLLIILGVFSPWISNSSTFFTPSIEAKWRGYTLPEAVSFVAKNGSTVIVCAVSQPYLPFLNNWLISIKRQKHHEKVLVIAEDYATLDIVNARWPGHAVLIPPAPDAQVAHKFGSQFVIVISLCKEPWFSSIVGMQMNQTFSKQFVNCLAVNSFVSETNTNKKFRSFS